MIKRRYQRMQSVKNSERIKQKTKKNCTHNYTLNKHHECQMYEKNEENNYTKNIDNETELFTYTKKKTTNENTERYRVKDLNE